VLDHAVMTAGQEHTAAAERLSAPLEARALDQDAPDLMEEDVAAVPQVAHGAVEEAAVDDVEVARRVVVGALEVEAVVAELERADGHVRQPRHPGDEGLLSHRLEHRA